MNQVCILRSNRPVHPLLFDTLAEMALRVWQLPKGRTVRHTFASEDFRGEVHCSTQRRVGVLGSFAGQEFTIVMVGDGMEELRVTFLANLAMLRAIYN